MKHKKHLIPEVNTKFGAPMGRCNEGKAKGKVYDQRVHMCSCCGAYDFGGAYWGTGKELRVKYNSSFTFIEFYRIK